MVDPKSNVRAASRKAYAMVERDLQEGRSMSSPTTLFKRHMKRLGWEMRGSGLSAQWHRVK